MDAAKASGFRDTVVEAPVPATRGETLLLRLRSWSHLNLVAIFSVALIATLCIIALATMLRKTSTQFWSQNFQPFCCRDEALMILRAVNQSIDPCDDFYGYVCSMAVAGSSEYSSPQYRISLGWAVDDVKRRGRRRSAADVMFDTLVEVVWERKRPPPRDIAQYVEAIAAVTTPSWQPDPFHVVRFLGLLSLRYGLPSILSFFAAYRDTVLRGTWNGCFWDSPNESELLSALDIMNKNLHTAVSVEEFLQFKDKIASVRGTNSSKNFSQPIYISPFIGISNLEWGAIVKELVLPVHPNVISFATREEDRIGDFVDILSNKNSHPVTMAYTVVCTAFNTRAWIEDIVSYPARRMITGEVQRKLSSCKDLDFCEIENALMAEEVSSTQKNEQVRALFTLIRDKMAHEASLHPLFSGVTEEELAKKLNQVRLVLPEEIAVSDISVPNVSKSFATNILAANAYTFEVTAVRLARQIPDPDSLMIPKAVRQGDLIFVPTNLFALFGSRFGWNSELHLAVVGVDIAAQLWSFLLESTWSFWIQKRIELRLKCFKQTYFGGSESEEYLNTATAALGVMSALDSAATAKWSVVSSVNNTEISLGRLMYLVWAYDRCPAVRSMSVELDMNLALRHSHGFREAFKCSQESRMTEPSCCLDNCLP